MVIKNRREEKLKRMVLKSVKKLIKDRVPKGITSQITDFALGELEELVLRIQIFK